MQSAKYSFLAFIVILCNQCDWSNAEPIRGNNIRTAKENEFPFVVGLLVNHPDYLPEESLFCSGSLISDKHVISAAHCLKIGIDVDHMKVHVGSIDLKKGKKYDIWNWITYDAWANQNQKPMKYKFNDIAIFTLTKSVDDPKIKPVALSYVRHELLYGKKATVAGWGRTNYGKRTQYLKKVNLRILSNKECEEKLLATRGKEISQPEKDLCTDADPYAYVDCGDSGGPLLSKNVLIGVTKSTCPRGKDKYPITGYVNQHTGIEFYRKFIEDVVENCKFVGENEIISKRMPSRCTIA